MKLFLLPLMLVLAAPSGQFLPKPDPASWNALLKEFVNQQHRVDYARFKKEGLERLREYIAHLGRPGNQPLSPNGKKALLINAYNAFTIQWILRNYPTRSIRDTSNPFTVARFTLGGEKVSLDQIESRLRQMRDPRIHAALVCAGRSCPPLRREAYVANRLNAQLNDNVREWLANKSLNEFYPKQGKAEISSIFKWYRQDFESYPGGLQGFLRKYAPPGVAHALGNRKLAIHFLNYDWALNDQ
ncbi:MAG: DUF547 domain-containing protein [Terriglobia bacterium]